MRMRFVIVVIVILMALLACAGDRAPLGLYQWRGYAEICLSSEEIGNGCSLAQTVAVFDTEEVCKVETVALLDRYRASILARDAAATVTANWACDEDRSVFNA